jgi:predicted transcriptional regulator
MICHSAWDRCSKLKDSPCRDISLFVRSARVIARGYRRISDKALLDHEKRKALYDLILQNPGIDLKTLVAYSGFNENTLRYHLSLLKKTQKIRVTNENCTLHFFENHGRYSDSEQKILSIQFSGKGSRILSLLNHTPGLSRGELAEKLGVAGSSVSKGIEKLVQEGLIFTQKDGKYIRYYPVSSHYVQRKPNSPNPEF